MPPAAVDPVSTLEAVAPLGVVIAALIDPT
jgi:hypothetical protein